MTLEKFRKWAFQTVQKYIKGIEPQVLLEMVTSNRNARIEKFIPNSSYDELMKRRIAHISKDIREFDNCYEYCFIPSYEEKYEGYEIHGIQLDQVNVILIELIDEIKLGGVEFEKDNFSIEQVVSWLEQMNIYVGNKNHTKQTIEQGNQVIQAFKFMGHVVALYSNGRRPIDLNINELHDITDIFNSTDITIDSSKSKNLNLELIIFLNNQEVYGVPRLEFDRQKDLVISNGNLLKIDYIDAYKNGIGFFRYNEVEPVASLIDSKTTVMIDIEREISKQICVINFKYLVDLGGFS